MAETTGIEWTDSTWSPFAGCTPISPGCKNCYATRVAIRLQAAGIQGFEGVVRSTPDGPKWTGKTNERSLDTRLKPLRWQRPRMIFVNSQSDTFHEGMPVEAIRQLFVTMALAPRHVFQVLTKRAKRMRDLLSDPSFSEHVLAVAHSAPNAPAEVTGATWPLKNVWLGVSVEDQKHADERVPELLDTPAALRFLSVEPLLGAVELPRFIRLGRVIGSDLVQVDEFKYFSPGGPPVAAGPGVHRVYLNKNGARSVLVTCGACRGKGCPGEDPYPCQGGKTALGIKPDECEDLGLGVDWVIVGGESGPGARPMHPEWVSSLRDQCSAADVPWFFKQWGQWVPQDHASDSLLSQLDSWSPDYVHACGEVLSFDGRRSQLGVTKPSREIESAREAVVLNVGKKDAGARLDGLEHREFPKVSRG